VTPWVSPLGRVGAFAIDPGFRCPVEVDGAPCGQSLHLEVGTEPSDGQFYAQVTCDGPEAHDLEEIAAAYTREVADA